MKHPNIQIDASAYLLAAVCVLLLPLNWLICWLIAVTFHESGHLTVLKICHVPIHEIRIGFLGAKITTGPMTALQEILCAGGGPVCSLLLLFLISCLPAAAMIGLIQGIFNLLPVYPFDGGRILRSLMFLIREKAVQRKTPCKE